MLALLFFALLTGAALAQMGGGQMGSASPNIPGVKIHGLDLNDYYAAEKVLLSNYCRLDYEGARLQADGWKRFKPLTSIRGNPDFDKVFVVTRYDIQTTEGATDLLLVNYKVVGFYDMSEGYTARSTNDAVSFRTQEQGGNMIVAEISSQVPHVSPRAAIEWMNLRVADPKTPELDRAHLNDAIAQLSKLVPQARPVGKKPVE